MTTVADVNAHPWWQRAAFYQVYPRSFASSRGSGVGDLEGIRQRLDYLAWLGVDALWISPFYPSPMRDAGYDIADFCDVDPRFGTLAEFDRLVADAHGLGVRILVDWVPNHTSDQHPWFVSSRSSRSSPRRDWYIWRDEPNNWRAAFGHASAWSLDEQTGQYYLHLFLPEQPDLNWREPEVQMAMHDVVKFWLDRGVDGFRIDVAHCIGKDESFADEPRCLAGEPLSDFNDQPFSHRVLRGVRRVVSSYPGERALVGEVNIRSTAIVASYYGSGDELHMSFNFPPLDAPWDEAVWRSCIREVETHLGPDVAWPTWVLSNHDNSRHRTRFGGSRPRARAAAVMLLSLRGTPFIYQGDELGLEDVVLSPGQAHDPGGRDGSRAPIPWTTDFPHGWDGGAPWLPFAPDAAARSVEAQRDDPTSELALYRRMLAHRRASPALQVGTFEELDGPPGALAYRRHHPAGDRLVVVNFLDHPVDVEVDGTWRVAVSSAPEGDGRPFDGKVGAVEAVVLARPSVTAAGAAG